MVDSLIGLIRTKTAAVGAAARTFSGALWLLLRSAPVEAPLMFALLLVQGLVPPLNALLLKRILDALGRGTAVAGMGWIFAAWAAAMTLAHLIRQWVLLVQSSLTEQFTAAIELRLMRKANAIPNLAAFEDAAFYDELQMLTRMAPHRPTNLIATSANLVPNLIATVTVAIILSAYSWWIPPLLVAATIPYGAINLRLQRQSWRTIVGQNPWTRAMRYFCGLTTTLQSAKEIRMYDAGALFERKYEAAFKQLVRQSRKDRLGYALTPLLVTVGFAAANLWTIWWFIARSQPGPAALSGVVFAVQSILILQENLGGLSGSIALLGGHLVFFERFAAFQNRAADGFKADGTLPAGALAHGLALDRVSFAYANGAPVLRDISVTIRPGETIAIVGENGAGKSTLVKLICRLYDPTSGAIAADAVDLREIDLAQWRGQISGVFQDFGRYNLTIEENVTMGAPAARPARSLAEAAALAGLLPHLERLPAGAATQLGVDFGGGELSGGQWQTIAIARALYRDASILILDEPTSALDPRAEYELYQRFSRLAAGKTTILITHRLASVQMADRILVLKAGALVEQGTHAELMELDGEYAALYTLQAAQYAMAGYVRK